MKTPLAILMNVILLLIFACPAPAQTPGQLEGNWLATLDVGGVKLRLVLKIQKAAAGYTAKLDSIDQGVNDLPIDSVSLNVNKVSFSAAQFGMSYEGTLNDKADEITGTFKQRSGAIQRRFRSRRFWPLN